MEAAQAGDREALDLLLRRHHDRIHAVCRRLTGNDADASDAAQEALISIVRALPRYDARARFGTWTYRIAVNASLDELRRRKRRALPVDDVSTAASAVLDGGSLGTEHVADRVDIDAALLELAPEFRAPVVLRDLCGLDYAEIAEVLGLPAGTVRSRISRGRSTLAARLAGNRPASAERPSTQP